jgi:Na+-transporting methylmalonyl-CoA/oxaloacetate decarboxylase gamma subunit
MFAVLIFSIIMVILTVAFRYFGSKYYDKIYGKEVEQTIVQEAAVREAAGSEDSDEELVAVITAAANEALHKHTVVKRIKSISQNESAWSQSGRLDAMGTHSVTINR